jgi:pimeloyl-ACP methyl ester carboxylesterase
MSHYKKLISTEMFIGELHMTKINKNEHMKTIYIFTGLGADERVFHKIKFENYHAVHIKWITPLQKESIEAYALRLTQQITTSHPILVGLSFGGMMAVEVAKHIATEKIVLISSSKNKTEIPFYYKLAGKMQLHKIIRATFLVRANKITNKIFSVRSSEDKKIVSSMMAASDVVFLNWAIDKIVHLKNEVVHKNLTHIHGSADRILPIRFVNADIVIKGGTHLMIMNKAAEVQEKILEAIK